MTTTEIKTVKPGGGGDYTSLNAWESAERANLVATDKIKVVEVYSGGNAATGEVDILNATWVTDTAHYIEIRAASGQQHNGVWDTNKAYWESSGYGSDFERDVRVTKMQVRTTTGYSPIYFGLASGREAIVDSCIIKRTGSTVARNTLWLNGGAITVKNCIVTSDVISPGPAQVITRGGSGTVVVYNCTIISGNVGVQCLAGGTSLTSQNNYLACRTAYSSVCYNVDGLNKGSNDATFNGEAPTSNLRNVPLSTATFLDVTEGSENFHLVVSAGNKLINNGANLTSQGVTTDIVGVARPQFGAFDIGAFENDVPICWNYTARYKGSNKLFKISGCGNYPKSLRVPSNIDKSTGRMIDDGVEIDPTEYEAI
jgi:hypothetical protein